jgi:hypothetical protein
VSLLRGQQGGGSRVAPLFGVRLPTMRTLLFVIAGLIVAWLIAYLIFVL